MNNYHEGDVYLKCIKVIKSCNTQKQYNHARQYIYLASKYLKDKDLQYLIMKYAIDFKMQNSWTYKGKPYHAK